jgi:hypothetical protein
LNVAAWQSFVIYHAVRRFGFLAWYLNQKKKQAGYSKIARSAPLKASDQPMHWDIGGKQWARILLKPNA